MLQFVLILGNFLMQTLNAICIEEKIRIDKKNEFGKKVTVQPHRRLQCQVTT